MTRDEASRLLAAYVAARFRSSTLWVTMAGSAEERAAAKAAKEAEDAVIDAMTKDVTP